MSAGDSSFFYLPSHSPCEGKGPGSPCRPWKKRQSSKAISSMAQEEIPLFLFLWSSGNFPSLLQKRDGAKELLMSYWRRRQKIKCYQTCLNGTLKIETNESFPWGHETTGSIGLLENYTFLFCQRFLAGRGDLDL